MRDTDVKDFPNEFYETGISLEEMGSFGFAWKYKDILEILEYLKNNNYGILGGDVLQLDEERIFFNYDNWSLDTKGITWKEYVDEGYELAKNYIENYYEKNGDNYCYNIIVTNELKALIYHGIGK